MSLNHRPSKLESDCGDDWHDHECGLPGEESKCPSCNLVEKSGEGWCAYNYDKPFWKGKRNK